jgi:carboxyl-terminal processing protease
MRLSPIYFRFIKLLAIALLTNQFVSFNALANPQTPAPVNSPASTAAQKSPKALVEEVWQIVERKYIDKNFNQQDWNAVRQRYLNQSYSSYEEAYQAIREMLELLDDPLTRFLNPVEFKTLQAPSSDVAGIGLKLVNNRDTQAVTIIEPMENSPAQKAGLLPQDTITAIDGKSVESKSVSEVAALLRGKAGTSVTLGVLRSGEPITFRVQRAKINISTVQYRADETASGLVGYIRLHEFTSHATQQMKAAIEALEKKNVKGYVIDLRSNPGGLFRASIEIARMWLSNGVIITSVDRDSKREQELANNGALTQKPLVVLVDGGSANGSEVLAAALQENQRALLVGTQTPGYSSVQLVQKLQNETGLFVTVSKWLTPAGRDIQGTGLVPDAVVEMTDRQRQGLLGERKIVTAADPQFAKALEMLNQKLRTPR